MEEILKKADNQARWQLAMTDEIIFMLDIIVVILLQNDILKVIFILKAIADLFTTIKKSLKVNRKD